MTSNVLIVAVASVLLALCSTGTVPVKVDLSQIKTFPRPSFQPSTTEIVNTPQSVLSASNGRVVNGNIAEEGQFRYQVQVVLNGGHFCGGSLISEKIVLTAAHCAVEDNGNVRPTWQYTIHLGSRHRWEGGHYVPVVRISSHWGYGSNLHNDVAIMEMQWAVNEWNVQPIALIDHQVPDWATITISGFGLEENNQTPILLKWAHFWLLPKDDCQRIMGWGYNELVCLGHHSYEGACSGDSGGPAVYQDKLMGVTSFVLNGCAGDLPDGYSSVLHHRDWIFQHM